MSLCLISSLAVSKQSCFLFLLLVFFTSVCLFSNLVTSDFSLLCCKCSHTCGPGVRHLLKQLLSFRQPFPLAATWQCLETFLGVTALVVEAREAVKHCTIPELPPTPQRTIFFKLWTAKVEKSCCQQSFLASDYFPGIYPLH